VKNFLVLLLAYALSQFFRAFLAVTAGDLSRDLGLDPGQLGSLQAAWLLAFAVTQFPVGYALDRIGPRRTLAGFLLIAVAGTVGLGLSQGYYGALAALALIGIGCAPILMSGFYLAARLYPPRHFATMSSFLVGFGSIGDPLSGAPLAYFLAAYGWRMTVFGIAGIVALTALLVALFLSDPPPVEHAGGRHPSLIEGIVQIVSKRRLWLIFPLVFTSYAATIATRGLWIAPYLQEVHGFGLRATSYAAMAMGILMALGAILGVPVQARLGPKATVASGAAVCVIGYFGLAFFGPSSASLAVGLFLVVGLFGVTYAVAMAHGRAFLDPHEIGRGVTFLNFVSMGGAGVLQWVSGRTVQAFGAAGADAQTTFGWLFGGFGVVLGTALLIYLFSRTGPEPARVTSK